MKFTGKSWEDKVKEIREQMKLKKADVLILSALDDVAWMLNLRGSDIQFNPVFKNKRNNLDKRLHQIFSKFENIGDIKIIISPFVHMQNI